MVFGMHRGCDTNPIMAGFGFQDDDHVINRRPERERQREREGERGRGRERA